MEKNLRDHLYHSAVLTFEELTFMFTDSDLDADQADASFEAGARVLFHGPINGSLTVCLYGNVLASLSSNMLGDLDDPNREIQLDALKEVVNVICGNLLPLIGGEAAVFDLQPPVVVTSDELPEVIEEKEFATVVGLEDGRAELILQLADAGS